MSLSPIQPQRVSLLPPRPGPSTPSFDLGTWRTWLLARIHPPGKSPVESGPWRPTQWSTQTPPVYSITVTLPVQGGKAGKTQTATYYFDAVLRAEHEQAVTVTQHPVQENVPVADHAFIEPARLSLLVGFSDAMDRFMVGDYNSSPSKSISAFNTFLKIQESRAACTISTRLRTYTNMVLVSVTAQDDNRTVKGLRAALTFQQIIPAQVSVGFSTVPAISERPDQTDKSPEGTKIPQNPDPTIDELYKVPYAPQTDSPFALPSGQPFTNALGAGDWSSAPIQAGGLLPGDLILPNWRIKQRERPNYLVKRIA